MTYTYEDVVADVITRWSEANGKDISTAEATALAAEIRPDRLTTPLYPIKSPGTSAPCAARAWKESSTDDA